jgi:hydrogenase-4 component F
VTRLAGGLLLIGYGAKAGLFPFHTWLADAHSQAPAPVSALMSGVLLSVAFSVLIRIKPIIDVATGPGVLRAGLLVIGLATLLIAALMLTVTPDVKRMLAYSSMENMGLIAIAAAAGTTLAIAALLLHVLAHGIGKTILFLAGGQLQAAHGSTAIVGITGVLKRSRLIGVSFAAGVVVLLGLPPFALFASELAIARSLTQAGLAWVLAAAMLLIAIAFAALARKSGRMLLGAARPNAVAITVPTTVATALLVGLAASIALGITAGPLAELFSIAAGHVAGVR